MVVGNGIDAILVVVLQICEPEESLLDEWSADAEPRLTASKKWK
jgi:hypothetical protein